MRQVMGTCGICGGPVSGEAVWHSILPPDPPTCEQCGAQAARHGPVLPMVVPLTDEERGIIDHALRGGSERVYRNRYNTAPGCDGWEACECLERRGLLVRRSGRRLGELVCFFVTTAGAAAAGLELPT